MDFHFSKNILKISCIEFLKTHAYDVVLNYNISFIKNTYFGIFEILCENSIFIKLLLFDDILKL